MYDKALMNAARFLLAVVQVSVRAGRIESDREICGLFFALANLLNLLHKHQQLSLQILPPLNLQLDVSPFLDFHHQPPAHRPAPPIAQRQFASDTVESDLAAQTPSQTSTPHLVDAKDQPPTLI